MFTKPTHEGSSVPVSGRTDRRGLRASRVSATVRAAWTAAALFCIVAAFHAAVALGAPWGEYTQGGGTSGTVTMSGRIVAALSCALSLGMAGAILSRVGTGPFGRLPARVSTVLAWLTTVYAVVGVVLNLITRSAAERALWAPVSVLLLGLVVFVVVATHHESAAHGEGLSSV